MASINIQIPDDLHISEHGLRILFADALAEFAARRTPVVDYVNKRYPDTPDYAWLDREVKVQQVLHRIRVAERLHNNVLDLKVVG